MTGVFVLFGMGMQSCSDSFLDTESKTETTTQNYYNTVDDAYRALVACYDGWQRTTSDGGLSFYEASEVMSDECFGGTGNTDGKNYMVVDRFEQSYSPADMDLFNTTWGSYYTAIFRCNTLLGYAEQIKWNTDESKKGTYLGETHALRAILYFDLVRLFGHVPLLTEPSSNNIPQADPDEVYATIVSDLQYAIENIPADAYPKSNAAKNDGHITKYAAEALLARVYLYYTGYYGKELAGTTKAEVLAGLEEVISSEEFDLVPNFKNLWPAASSTPIEGELAFDTTYAGDGNVETVLSLKFNTTQDYNGNVDGNSWLVMLGLRNTDFSPYGKGWGACTVNPSTFLAYSKGDTRKEASIIDIQREGIAPIYDIRGQREYTGYAVKKYTPLAYYDGTSASKADGSGDFQIAQHQDYVLIRYADVLLMAAELGSPQAQSYFNQVRERAYTMDGVLSDSYKEITVNLASILEERHLEFAFEGIRYWDLMRQGVDSAAVVIAETTQVLDGGNETTLSILAQDIIDKKGLQQIPNTQITLSKGVLVQNPGW